ncbi:MAG: N-6 DNA methylase [Ruminococcus sp.]|nr:N-6 DNA methylase [Ruminococcus sp.]
MNNKKEILQTLQERIKQLLENLQIEQEKKPLRLALQTGYLSYVRLFIESQKRAELQQYFPYAGFPMEWTKAEESMELQQRIWQVQYQMQYCASIVEEGHFLEKAELMEKGKGLEEVTGLIDWMCEQSDWSEGIPEIFALSLKEMIQQIYQLGNSGMFLMPEVITNMLVELAGEKEHCKMWNPACRTGAFLAAMHKTHPQWELSGSETSKEQCILAQMLQFFHGAGIGNVKNEDALEVGAKNVYDLIVSNPPVGELRVEDQERYPVVTRKIQLQYLQMIMEGLKKQGLAIVVVNEGILFKFDAEMKIRKELLESFELQGIISLPAGAFLPYTSGKASIMIFANAPERVGEHSAVWFYELNHLGYTLDRRQEETGANQIPELLQAWSQRKEMEVEWNRQLAAGTLYNQWNNPVPESWKENHYWFASRATIRNNDYNLTAGRYKPWKEDQEETVESPLQLLQQLAEMEKETMEQIKELIEMTKDYE